MSTLRGRDLPKAGALVGAVGLPRDANAVGGKMPLMVFDGRLAEARRFVRTQPAALRIDLARADATRRALIRSGLPPGRPVEGPTRWSDWVGLRGELQAQDFRLAYERLVPRAPTGRTELVRWQMVQR